MQTRLFLLALVSASLAGCAAVPAPTQAMLTYETVPEGAVIYEGTQNLGPAPVTRTYNSDGKSTTIRTPEVTAVWPSGAKESYYTLIPVGADRTATIERPKAAPGLQADLDNAKKFISAKDAEARRIKEAAARDLARGSDRCKVQQSKGNVATNDC